MTPEAAGSKDPGQYGNRAVSRSAFRAMVGGVITMVATLASQMLVAAVFGAGAQMDAYLTALVIPAYLEAVLLAGLPFVFVPAFVQAEMEGGEDAWSLVGTFLWLVGGVLALVALGGALFAPSIIALSAPGLSPDKAALSARMLSVLMLSVPFVGLRTLTRGVQNARGSFFWPSVANAFSAAANLVVLLALYRVVGPMALAWGFLVAEIARASVTVTPVLRHGWNELLPLRDERVHEMFRLMIPFVLLGLITRSTNVFERFFASGLPDGDLSYLGYASRVPQMFMLLVGTSITAAVFPAMARAYSERGERGLVERADYGLRLSLAVSLPALALLSGIALPMVAALFERGAFGPNDTLSVAKVVPIVMVGAVICPMVGNLLTRMFYVTKDTTTVSVIRSVTIVLYILLARVLADGWGYVGLALARPAYRIAAIGILILLLLRKLPDWRGTRVHLYALGYGAIALVAFLVAWLTSRLPTSLPDLVLAVLGALAGGLLYLLALYWFDREIATSVLELTGVTRVLRGIQVGFRYLSQAARG